MPDTRICKSVNGVGPRIGSAALIADQRICLPKMNVQLMSGDETSIIIIYGAAGAITYGSAGKIKY